MADRLLDQAQAGDPENLQVLLERATRLETEGRLEEALTARGLAYRLSNWSMPIGKALETLRARMPAT